MEKQNKRVGVTKKEKQSRGITLIALVVTIVVLIILATVSISTVLGENGLIARAERAREAHEQAGEAEETTLNEVGNYVGNYLSGGSTGGSGSGLDVDSLPTGPNGKPLVSGVTTTEHDTITGEDEKGNQVVVPGGFKIAEDSGTTVQEGIVIEDASGNQFVWIPVSNINHDGSNKIKIEKDGTEAEVEITLGRYTFASAGAETKVQYGSEYAATTLEAVQAGTVTSYRAKNERSDYFYELTEFRESNYKHDSTGTNATAKDLAGFINSVSTNKGYYLARYEASYASGSEFGVGNDSKYYKPASKVSTANSEYDMNYSEGTLWNHIAQGNASKASRQMYYGDRYVESDLTNSYAWDTAIVYIQAMENSNYANAKDGNGILKNTGETGDEKCKIFDMAKNCQEWTTEYSTYTGSYGAYHCTGRGGYYISSNDSSYIRYTSYRDSYNADRRQQVLFVQAPTLCKVTLKTMVILQLDK